MMLFPALKSLATLLIVLLAGVLVFLIIEMVRHRAALRRIPIRIHVNGTRGKSSVTRLIAAGLRAGGIRTFAKTTGSAAKFIHTDGTEEPVVRRSSPNIREQTGIVRQAAGENAEALVIECMAIRPDLQRISEKRIVHSTIGVITNVRPDHLEVMGPHLGDVARALSGTIPRGGTTFVTDSGFNDFFERTARRRGSTLHVTSGKSEPTAEEMRGFRHVEIPENVALALDVCAEVGIERATALEGMHQVIPDVGATTLFNLSRAGKQLLFANAFAANDPHSTAFLWRLLGMDAPQGSRFVEAGPGEVEAGILISNRADRMRRAVDLAEIFEKQIHASWYLVAGQQAPAFIEQAARMKVPRQKLINMGNRAPGEVLDKLFELTKKQTMVLGIGNIGGFGMEFIQLLEKEGKR
jgi:gamma-polyglutamate synthase